LEDELKLKTDFLDAVTDSIFFHDFEGNFIYLNKPAYQSRGYTQEELMGMNLHDLDLPPYEKLIKSHLNDLITKGELTFESEHFCKDGSILPVEIHARTIDFKGKNYILSIARNIAEHKELKKESDKAATLSSIINAIPDAIIVTDLKGIIVQINQALTDIYGYGNEILGQSSTIMIKPSQMDEMVKSKEIILRNGLYLNKEFTLLTAGHEDIETIVSAVLLKDKTGTPINIIAVARDITQIKKAEKKIKSAFNYNRGLIEASLDPLVTIGPDGTITDVNSATEQITGYSRKYLIGTDFSYYFTNPKKAKEGYEKAFDKGVVRDYPLQIRHKNGETTPVLYNATVYHDTNGEIIGIFAAARDITQIKKAEKKIEKSLKEKEMLLQEIHHRVKNNLMVISSLLNLQSNYIKDKDDLELFRESQTRAKSMALIHERLYKSGDLKSIDFGEYLLTLTNDLFHSYISDPTQIALSIEVENIFVDINTAIPLGLIVNELVSNVLKYAFPKDQKGTINIKFGKFGSVDKQLTLIIADDGVGFSEDIDFENTKTLGLQLVNTLVNQLDCRIELDSTSGTKFIITFSEELF